jgi:hypothetical protein
VGRLAGLEPVAREHQRVAARGQGDVVVRVTGAGDGVPVIPAFVGVPAEEVGLLGAADAREAVPSGRAPSPPRFRSTLRSSGRGASPRRVPGRLNGRCPRQPERPAPHPRPRQSDGSLSSSSP